MTQSPATGDGTAVDAETDRLDEWQRLIAARLLTLHMIPDGSPSFHGRVRSRRFGDISLAVLHATSHRLERTSGRLAAGESAYLNISLQLDGTSTIGQYGRFAALDPGDFVLYDTSATYVREFPKEYGSFVLMLPRSRIGLPLDAIRSICAVKVSGAAGLGAVVSRFLREASDHLDAIHADAGTRLAQAIIDLVAATIIDALGVAIGEDDFRDRRLRVAVHEYIDQHFDDVGCRAETIAAAFHVSRRHLYDVFATESTTVAELLRTRRLESARAVLEDPAQRWRTVADIARDSGFASVAAFTNAFRARYGATPKTVRPPRVPASRNSRKVFRDRRPDVRPSIHHGENPTGDGTSQQRH